MSEARKTVRVGALEQTLGEFAEQMNDGVRAILKKYHGEYVAPLEARVRWLETPWYERAYVRFLLWRKG